MIAWRTHRLWMALAVLALLIGIGGAPALNVAQEKTEKKLTVLRAEKNKTQESLARLQEDIAAAEKMKTEIGVQEAEKIMATTNRLRAAHLLERCATEALLSNLTYTFSPERKTPMETTSAGAQNLATSRWIIAADAPTDLAVQGFLDALAHTLQGRLTIRRLALQRLGSSELSGANLHMQAEGEWLSNGAAENLAEDTHDIAP